jgi:cytochrome o ubiquinol oxidase subunit 2
MGKKLTLLLASLLICVGVVAAALYVGHDHIAILSPAGTIAAQQRKLLIGATLLMLLIVIPVFVLTISIAWKYRATNAEADYQPEWDHNRRLELLWWGLPCLIIAILAVVAWNSSHSLDPSRALASSKPPITIQVIALQWKWLFIYPEQRIASVNYVQFPANTPVDFEITADAPMNSFWIPRLGGQIYAMSGMTTHLHLMADQPGKFQGTSANLSGSGFAGMRFTAEAATDNSFKDWVTATQSKPASLTTAAYNTLARPGTAQPGQQYGSYEHNLYDTVVMKYMSAPHEDTTTQAADGSTMNMAAHE